MASVEQSADHNNHSKRGDVLSYAAVALLVTVIVLLFFGDLPPTSKDLMLIVLGALISIVKDVYAHQFRPKE